MPPVPTIAQRPFKVVLLDRDEALEERCGQQVRERSWKEALEMLSCVLSRTNVATSEVLQQRQLENTPSSSSLSPAATNASVSSAIMSQQYRGYSPESTLRSVRTLIDLGAGEELYAELERRFAQHASFAVSLVVAQEAAEVLKEGSHQTVTATDGTTHTVQLTASQVAMLSSTRAFGRMTRLWEGFTLAVMEVESVWVYANRWALMRRTSSGAITSATAVAAAAARGANSASSAAPCEGEDKASAMTVTSSTLFGATPLRAMAVHCLRNALDAYPELLDKAIDGFLLCISVDMKRHKAPVGVRRRRTDVDALHIEDDEDVVDLTWGGTVDISRSRLRLFTDLLMAIDQYLTRVQPGVVSVAQNNYIENAVRMLSEQVPAAEYFRFAEDALDEEKRRSAEYLHQHTLPLIEDCARFALLRDAGKETLRRDFSELAENAQYDTLSLAWHLFTLNGITKDTAYMRGVFRKYLEHRGAEYMDELLVRPTTAGERGPPATMLKGPFPVARALILLMHRGEALIRNSFQADEMEFNVQLHEAMQATLGHCGTMFSEQLAAYLDSTLKEVEQGERPLTSSWPSGEEASLPSAGAKRSVESVEEEVEEEVKIQDKKADIDKEMEEGEEQGQQQQEGDRCSGNTRTSTATEILRDIASIFSYHPHKEIFEACYWRDLARRLMHPHRVANQEAEVLFLEMLKKICGPSFTSKFEGMLRDVASANGITEEYKTWLAQRSTGEAATSAADPALTEVEEEQQQKNTSSDSQGTKAAPTGGAAQSVATLDITAEEIARLPKVDLRLVLFTKGFWPKFTPLLPQLPPPLSLLTHSVEAFFQKTRHNRYLTWQHQLSYGVLKGRVQRSCGPVKHFTGTFMQCLLLMKLDEACPRDSDAITAEALCRALSVDLQAPEVMGALLGLCHEKLGLVLRSGASSSPSSPTTGVSSSSALAPTEELRLNAHFTSASAKIRLPFQIRKVVDTPDTDSAAAAAAAHQEKVAKEKAYLLEAGVVKYMKANRTAKHDALVEAVVSGVKAPVNAAAVKKVIEKLIDRGFLERNGPDSYKYVA